MAMLIASGRGTTDGASRQMVRLNDENVEVTVDAMGVRSVNLNEYGWFPEPPPMEVEPGEDNGESWIS